VEYLALICKLAQQQQQQQYLSQAAALHVSTAYSTEGFRSRVLILQRKLLGVLECFIGRSFLT
jgi:hypothetical protein